jgi:hypothetical protein
MARNASWLALPLLFGARIACLQEAKLNGISFDRLPWSDIQSETACKTMAVIKYR